MYGTLGGRVTRRSDLILPRLLHLKFQALTGFDGERRSALRFERPSGAGRGGAKSRPLKRKTLPGRAGASVRELTRPLHIKPLRTAGPFGSFAAISGATTIRIPEK